MNSQFEGDEYDFIDGPALEAAWEKDVSRADTPEMVRFRAFFHGIGARHFKPDEFMVLGPSNRPGGSCEGRNSLPSEDIWANVVALVKAMDAIRDELGEAVRITNCYRNTAYNACVGGATHSQHKLFQAADWICRSGTTQDWSDAAKRVRRQGLFSGGIGVYRSFVHVDVRGQDVDWDNR